MCSPVPARAPTVKGLLLQSLSIGLKGLCEYTLNDSSMSSMYLQVHVFVPVCIYICMSVCVYTHPPTYLPTYLQTPCFAKISGVPRVPKPLFLKTMLGSMAVCDGQLTLFKHLRTISSEAVLKSRDPQNNDFAMLCGGSNYKNLAPQKLPKPELVYCS